jgi:RimJ/RimL family protein N-acetyltransferase
MAVKFQEISREELIGDNIFEYLLANEALNNNSVTAVATLRKDTETDFYFALTLTLGEELCGLLLLNNINGLNFLILDLAPTFPQHFLLSIVEKLFVVAVELEVRFGVLESFMFNNFQLASRMLQNDKYKIILKRELHIVEDLLIYEVEQANLNENRSKLLDGFFFRAPKVKEFDFVLQCLEEFRSELGFPPMSDEEARDSVAFWIKDKRRYILLDAKDIPVSIVGWLSLTSTSKMIHSVYTPPYFRQRSYATICVGQLCKALFEQGTKKIMLHADPDNPTANKMYSNLGFRLAGRATTLKEKKT